MHRDFIAILASAGRCVEKVSVNTNGIRLADLDFAERVNAVAPNVLITVSLDGFDPLVNDRNRGAGGRKAIQAIRNLSRLKQPLCISTVLTNENIDTAFEIIDGFYPEVTAFRFSAEIPTGVVSLGRNGPDYLERIKLFCDRADQRRIQDKRLSILLPFRRYKAQQKGSVFDWVKSCCCAYTKMYIDSRLNAYPCYYSAGRSNIIGNLSSMSIADLWSNSVAEHLRLRAQSEALCGTSPTSANVPSRYSDPAPQVGT